MARRALQVRDPAPPPVAHEGAGARAEASASLEYEQLERQALALWSSGRKDEALALVERRIAQAKGRPSTAKNAAAASVRAPSRPARRLPSSLRFAIIAGLVLASAYGAMVALAAVEPRQREFVIDVAPERLQPPPG